MFVEHAYNRSVYLSIILLLLTSLILTACGVTAATPPPASAVTTSTHTVKLTVDTVNLQVGKETAILVEIQPYKDLTWTWEVSGTGEGSLNETTGENVVYKAGKAGVDTVTARAELSDGTILRQSITINVEAVATEAVLPTQTPPPARVTLESLQDQQEVPCENMVSGTYPSDLEQPIWPIVYIDGIYYPQGEPAEKVAGNWYQTVRFGNCDTLAVDKGKRFQLIILTANPSANATLEEYIQNAQATGNWGGMAELPSSGIEEHARILVIRQ